MWKWFKDESNQKTLTWLVLAVFGGLVGLWKFYSTDVKTQTPATPVIAAQATVPPTTAPVVQQPEHLPEPKKPYQKIEATGINSTAIGAGDNATIVIKK